MEPVELVPGSSEIGSLTAHSNEDSQFVGSSSGVYFINTVKQAFSNGLDTSGSPETQFPIAEDTLVGAEDSPRRKRQRTESSRSHSTSPTGAREFPATWRYDPEIAALLGDAPPLHFAKELMMMYFKVWHPLFPFLHGPTFLQAMERLYATTDSAPSTTESSPDHRSICWTVILQCIFNLGSLLHPDTDLPQISRIRSPAKMTLLLGVFANKHDIASLQALLAVQVYLVANMSLRLASTFGGCILRSMMHAGLHRCPFRYTQLSSHDRQLRKRIFWCAYAIDRYLSQALGLPLGIQDSDIDVCLPAAPEMHSPKPLRGLAPDATPSVSARTEETSAGERPIGNGRDENQRSLPPQDAGDMDHRKKESVLASYVDSGTLTGRALELFHKSLLVRSVRRSSVLYLVTDVHKWWNSLPLDLQGKSTGLVSSANADSPFDFGPFFTVLYQHLILIIHRPSLSLEPSSAEFCSGLQTCIGAARGIIAALKLQVESGQALFWPGFLSAAWMSGLVLAFACQLKQYVLAKGLQEIDSCSEFLDLMSSQWETAQHCHSALSFLATRVRQAGDDSTGSTRSHAYALSNKREANPLDVSRGRRKEPMRFHDDTSSEGAARAIEEEPGQWGPALNTEFEGSRLQETMPHTDAVSPHTMNFRGNTFLADTRSSLDLNFPDVTSYFVNGPNFDLNMVDLLQEANFDSLFDGWTATP